MRPLRKGDVVRLRANLPADTVKGVRAMQAGHEFELIDCRDGWAKCWDGNGVKVLLPVRAVEFVRSAHSPPDDPPTPPAGDSGDDGDHTGGGPVGVAGRASKLGNRRGLVRLPRAA